MMGDAEEREVEREGEREAERRREEAYRVYVTDALYALCGFAGIRLKGRYCDLVRAHRRDGMGTALERLGDMGIEVVK